MHWTKGVPWFPEHELKCKGTGIIRLDMRFAAMLPSLRQEWGEPLQPTSVCRTPQYNSQIRGHPRSLHLTLNPFHDTDGCMAADLYWEQWDNGKRLDFAQLAWELGFSVGLNERFVHVDLRKEVGLEQTVFVYDNWSLAFDGGDVMVE